MTPKPYSYDNEEPIDDTETTMKTVLNSTNGGSGGEYVPSQGPTATQLLCGTELFSDTIYSKPVTPPNTTYQHCLIDSSVRAARIKSNLMGSNPVESSFSDNSHGLAVTELVQLEEHQGNANVFDLVYYQHPIGERTDGAKTEGLERIVIKSNITGATKLFSSLAGSNNVAVMNSNGNLTFTAQCLLYVEINNGSSDGLLIYGKAVSVIKGPNYSVVPDTIGNYKWNVDKMSSMNINTGYKSVRKFVNSGYDRKTGLFHEKNSYQHIVFNENSGAHTLTMTPEGNISSAKLYYPSHANDAPVMHIEWNTNENRIDKCVFYKASTHDDKSGNRFLITQSYEGYKVHKGPKNVQTKLPVTCTYTEFDEKNHDSANNPPQSVDPVNDNTGYGAYQYDWSKVNSVHDLYSFEDSNGNVYYVKLVEVSDQAYPSIVVLEDAAEKHWWHRASYPLKTPDPDTGRGNISKIVSCFSKFGGMRYFFQDSNNNLYLSRQQRLDTNGTPYGKPIYGPYDVNGKVETSFGSEPLSYKKQGGVDWHDIAGNCYQTSSSVNIGPNKIPEQLVLSTLMAFDTNTSSGNTAYDGSAQAVCLSAGGVVDVATPRRTYHDSEYVSATISPDDSGSTTTVGLYRSVNSLLERSWYHHEITSQIDYNPDETQDSGDYYHLTLTPADDDGNIASLTTNDANKHLLVEIRSDAPCSVTDMVSNYYHSINRYASFMAEVDPATKQANIVLKATQFGQNIYARLVDSRALEAASESDIGLIGSSNGEKVFPWQLINISEQAQYRMGNATSPGSSLQPGAPDSNSFMDTFVYVTGDTIANRTNPVDQKDGTNGPNYETKGNFKMTPSGMQPTADFINQSGTNMLTVSSESSSYQTLYAQGTSSDKFDPLYCMQNTSSTLTTVSNTTSFTYATGEVANEPDGFSATNSLVEGELGCNVFKKVSHDVGDALHHLQHLSDKAYKNINNGVKISINAAASDAICIDKSIMKAVNGIDEDLNEVIDTVEQYASIVVEVLKTIIKNSFMYEFIEMIIWLVSLFRYLSDIHDLAKSLKETFLEALQNPPEMAATDVSKEIEKYIGPNGKTAIDKIFNSATNVSKQYGDKPPTNKLLNTVISNPFTNKLINLAVNKASKASGVTDVLEFDYDTPTAADSLFDDLISDGAISELTNLKQTMNSQLAEDLVGMVSQDVMDPQKIYQDFVGQISSIMGEIETDFITSTVDIIGKMGNPIYDNQQNTQDDGKYNLYFVEQLIKSESYLKLNLGIVGDLFKLCGLGSGSSSSLKVKGTDAIFFPMALAVWVGLYIIKGKSYSSVPSPKAEQGELGDSDSFDWFGEVGELVSAVFGACSGTFWGPCNPPDGEAASLDKEGFQKLSDACGVIVSVAQFTCFYGDNHKKPFSLGNAFDNVFVSGQLITSLAGFASNKFSMQYTNDSTKDAVDKYLKFLYAFITLVDMFGDIGIVSVQGDNAEDAVLGVVGGDVMTNVGTFTDLVYFLVNAQSQASMFDYAWPIIGSVPTIGYVMGAVEVAAE